MNHRTRAQITFDALRAAIPSPQTELRFETPYQLVAAVILSAQCTDARVNLATPALFAAYPDFEALAAAQPEEVLPYIRSISYPNNKARHLAGMARMVMERFGGALPESVEALTQLPGVGRKTAQVVAGVAFGQAALAVDTHVFRVANRIGLVQRADTPLKVERGLKALLPPETWDEAHHLLILHGRYTCTARNPQCLRCPVAPVCVYFARLERLPPPLEGLDPARGRFYCKTRGHYFDAPAERTDRYGAAQRACPRCGSMQLYDARTGASLRRAPDFRIR